MVTLFLLLMTLIVISFGVTIWLFTAGFWYLDIFVAVLVVLGIIKLIKAFK